MSNLSLRIIFGALYVALMVGGALLGSPFFGVLMALLVFLSINELAVLAKKNVQSAPVGKSGSICWGDFIFDVCGI